MYVGTNGIRSNGTGGQYTKISGGSIQTNQTIQTTGFYTTGSAYMSGGDVNASNFKVNGTSGKSTGSFSVQAYVNGSLTWVGLNFSNGVLVGASGF